MVKRNPLVKNLLFALLIDIVILSIFVWWINATPDVSIVEIVIVPILFAINMVAALGFALSKKSSLAKAFSINSFLAPIIFHCLFSAWFAYYGQSNFKRYHFQLDNKRFEILLNRRDTIYSISERGNGWSTELKNGHYIQKTDSIILSDSTKVMYIHKGKLIGYPQNNIIVLTE